MNLQKFGIKLFFQPNGSFSYRDFIPELHQWIQNDSIDDHLLIDVVDYSHIPDGPGIMLVAHEGHFSLDQENFKPGLLYMRKKNISGSFKDRFNKVLSITIQSAQLLKNNNINKKLDFSNNSLRFISNDRRLVDNIDTNQKLYTDTVTKLFKENYPGSKFEFDNYSQREERFAFDVNFMDNTNILDYRTKEEGNE